MGVFLVGGEMQLKTGSSTNQHVNIPWSRTIATPSQYHSLTHKPWSLNPQIR